MTIAKLRRSRYCAGAILYYDEKDLLTLTFDLSYPAQNLLQIFNSEKKLNDLSDTLNATVLSQTSDEDSIKDLKAKLKAAGEKTRAAEQYLVKVKAKTNGLQGQVDSTMRAAEDQSQSMCLSSFFHSKAKSDDNTFSSTVALLEQMSIYNELMSIKLNDSIRTTITFGWPDVGKWINGANSALGVASGIVGSIASISECSDRVLFFASHQLTRRRVFLSYLV